MGEPIHWETNLQVLIDLLITNGMPNESLQEIPTQNIPVIAANPDLLWMSEAANPRWTIYYINANQQLAAYVVMLVRLFH